VNFSKDKNIFLLIGSTGSGKTSLISYLTGMNLNYESDDSERGITLKDNIPGFEISSGDESITKLPNFRTLNES
jgi:ABC-type branched-subunit amino acid transport system ATPase component